MNEATCPVGRIVTELAVLEPMPEGLLRDEGAPGVGAQDVIAITERGARPSDRSPNDASRAAARRRSS